MTTILALDTSTRRTGWVRGGIRGPVHVGCFEVRESERFDLGRLLTEWDRQARPLFEGVDKVFFEAPILPNGGTQIRTLRQLYAIAAHVELLAHQGNVDCVEVENYKHKKLIYGHGGAKPANPEAFAKSWGLPARNADEADACGVFLYGIQQEYPEAFTAWLRLHAKSPAVARIERPKKRASKQPRGKVQKQKKPGQNGPTLFDT